MDGYRVDFRVALMRLRIYSTSRRTKKRVCRRTARHGSNFGDSCTIRHDSDVALQSSCCARRRSANDRRFAIVDFRDRKRTEQHG